MVRPEEARGCGKTPDQTLQVDIGSCCRVISLHRGERRSGKPRAFRAARRLRSSTSGVPPAGRAAIEGQIACGILHPPDNRASAQLAIDPRRDFEPLASHSPRYPCAMLGAGRRWSVQACPPCFGGREHASPHRTSLIFGRSSLISVRLAQAVGIRPDSDMGRQRRDDLLSFAGFANDQAAQPIKLSLFLTSGCARYRF